MIQRQLGQSDQRFEKLISFLQLESERAILEYKSIIGASRATNEPKDSENEEEDLYKNEFRV